MGDDYFTVLSTRRCQLVLRSFWALNFQKNVEKLDSYGGSRDWFVYTKKTQGILFSVHKRDSDKLFSYLHWEMDKKKLS